MFELATWHYVQNVLKTYVAVQLLSHVQLFATPWTAARQAFLLFTLSQSLSKLTSIELVMPSNHLVLCRLLLLPSISTSIRVADYIFQRWPQQHIPLPPYARPTMWSWRCSVERWESTCPPQPARASAVEVMPQGFQGQVRKDHIASTTALGAHKPLEP